MNSVKEFTYALLGDHTRAASELTPPLVVAKPSLKEKPHLDERVSMALAEIPVARQTEGISLATLQSLLQAKWGTPAHPGELGAALRRRGWHRIRRWIDGNAGFKALWFPAHD